MFRKRKRIIDADLHRENTNVFFYLLYTIAAVAAGGILTESYVQSYYIRIGFDARLISYIGFTTQVASMSAYLFMTTFTAAKPGAHLRLCIGALIMTLNPIGLICISMFYQNVTAVLIMALCMATVIGFTGAYRFTIEMSVIPYMFRREQYAAVQGRSGVIGGAIAAVISLGAGTAMRNARFPTGYVVMFSISATLLIMVTVFSIFFKLGSPKPVEGGERAKMREIVRLVFTKRYISKLIPHFLRGFGQAGFYFFMPAALRNITLSDTAMVYYIPVGVVATTLGFVLYIRMVNMFKSGSMVLYGNIICAMCGVFITLNKSVVLFFVVYALFTCVNVVAQYGVPTGVLRSTSAEDMPVITSMRMMFMNCAYSIALLTYGSLFEMIHPAFILIFSGSIYILCGFMFRRLFTDTIS